MSIPEDEDRVRVARLDLAEVVDYIGQDIQERQIHVPDEVREAHGRLAAELRDRDPSCSR